MNIKNLKKKIICFFAEHNKTYHVKKWLDGESHLPQVESYWTCDRCGIKKPGFCEHDAPQLEAWIDYHVKQALTERMKG